MYNQAEKRTHVLMFVLLFPPDFQSVNTNFCWFINGKSDGFKQQHR
jgi:hypothetical protein